MNAIGSHVSGLQHIGLPTNDMEKTLAFYEKLGFTVAFRTVNNGEKVCFLKLAGVCVETYENGQAVGTAGAIDHIALDVDDVQAAWDAVRAAGFAPTAKKWNSARCCKRLARSAPSALVGIVSTAHIYLVQNWRICIKHLQT